MDLSPAESVLVDFIRGKPETDFNMSIARNNGRWLFTAASPSDGFLVGDGASFDAAFSEAMGADAEPGSPGGGEETPARVGLRLVVNTERNPAQAKAAA